MAAKKLIAGPAATMIARYRSLYAEALRRPGALG